MVLVDRADTDGRFVTSGGYQKFAESPEHLIKPRSVTDINWDPSSEFPLREHRLPNGIILQLALSPKIQGFRAQTGMDFGTNIHPAAHLMEHMMRYSADIPDLRRLMNLSVVRCKGTTNPQYLSYAPELDNTYALELSRENPRFSVDMLYLLFALTARTDINEANRAIEASRMTTESLGRQDSPISRFYDKVLPIVVDDEGRSLPALEKELSHSTGDLLDLHRLLPIQTSVLEFSGNPQRNTDIAAAEIAEAALETFGSLKPDFTFTVRPQKNEGFFRNHGTRVSVYPAYGFLSDYVGISTVNKKTGDPRADYAERLFVFLLDEEFQRQMSRDGLFYENYFSANSFELDGIKINFSGLRTSQAGKTIDSTEEVLKRVLEGSVDTDLAASFEAAKRGDINFHFQTLGLARMNLARYMGVSTSDNCTGLYELMRSMEIGEVLESGRKLYQDRRLGLIHYGSANLIPRPGFTFTSEGALTS